LKVWERRRLFIHPNLILLSSWFSPLLICSLIATTPVFATELWSNGQHELGSHGYLRAGFGTSGGETQTCFKAPGAGSKFRFGNECEVWGELNPYYHYAFGNGEAPYIHYEQKIPFIVPYGKKLKILKNDENYLEVGNIADTPVKVSFGRRRFYRRDVHISDYFFVERSGDGISVQGIPLGFADFGYTYLTNKQTPSGLTRADRVRQHDHDFSLYNIETNADGSLDLSLRFARTGSTSLGSANIHSANGWAIGVEHKQKNVLNGTNTLSLQYGQGAARSAWRTLFENANALGSLTSATAVTDLEKAATWRLVNQHLYDGVNWAMQSAFVWEDKKSIAFDGINQTWGSIGVRPTYYIDQKWRGTVEVGLDYVNDRAAASDGHLVKATTGLEWVPERGFFARPSVRAYVTNAFWSDSFVGQVGGPIFNNDNHGWNAGIQYEIWW
jgi:maltoporin